MKSLVLDIETNGFLDAATQVHCLVLRDMDSDRVVSCTNSAPGYARIEEGLSLLSEADVVYGHKIRTFDVLVLEKLYPQLKLKAQVRDTLLIASMRWAHIEGVDWEEYRKGRMPAQMVGKQSIEAWGYRVGVQKRGVEITDWSQWTQVMQDRCEDDTMICKLLVQRIRASGVSSESVETEHELADYLFHQEHNGWPFNVEKARALHASLAAKRQTVEDELRKMFKSWKVSLGMFTPKVNSKRFGYVKGVPVERFKIIEFNPQSRDHIANRLMKLYGWKPEEFTEGGKPKVDENTLKGLDAPPVPKLREYLLIQKRISQLAESKKKNSWMDHITKDQPDGGKLTGLFHIHGGVIQNRAVTHRASHVRPNIAQVPKVGNPYGAECRELFCVPPGWVQLGADASGLELRVLAHYLAKYDDGAYATELLKGDIHSITREALQEWVDEGKKGRDTSKTWKYAFLYGAGDEKLGKVLITGASEVLVPKLRKWAKNTDTLKKLGAKSRAMYLGKMAALKYLLNTIGKQVKNHGYVPLIDGRRCYIRSEHAALNSLIQGTGAVICKRWIVEYNRRFVAEFGPQGWRGKWAALAWVHDENQLAVRPEIQTRSGIVIVASIEHMTNHFSFRCPLTGEAKFGANWKETH